MNYDAFAESVKLLEGAPPAREARLSRRIRYLPLAVDRDGDVAATMFLRRGVSGLPMIDVHALESTHCGWRRLGSGSGGYDSAVERRPALADLTSPAVRLGGGGSARPAGELPDRCGEDWISWAELRAAEDVAVLRVNGRRVPVANHGMVVVVWTGRPPMVHAWDASGTVLGSVPIVRCRTVLPPSYR